MVPRASCGRQGGVAPRSRQPALRRHITSPSCHRPPDALRRALLRQGRDGEPHQGVPTSSPTAPPPCAPISSASGSPPWPMSCSPRSDGSRLPEPALPELHAAPYASNSSRSAPRSGSAQGVSVSPWRRHVPMPISSHRLTADYAADPAQLNPPLNNRKHVPADPAPQAQQTPSRSRTKSQKRYAQNSANGKILSNSRRYEKCGLKSFQKHANTET